MIRYQPTRITLGDGDLRYHLQRLLNRHSRLTEWHQHDQFLNDSSFDGGEDDAFLESDSDLFSAPSVSPPDSICYSAPDEAFEDGSSPRGRGGGDHNTRTECPPEASTSPSSTKGTGSPVIVQPSALSLETARSAEKNVDVHEPLDTRAVLLTNLLTDLLLEKQPTQQSVELNRTHTNLDAADEERGTKSDIENHPHKEEFRSTSITDTMVDGGKTKLQSSKKSTRGQRASNLLGDVVPSCDSCAGGAHNPTPLDDKATSVTESQHDSRSHSRLTEARLHGCPVDNGGAKNTQRPTKLVKLKGINLAVIDKLSPSAQTDIGQSLRVPDRDPGTGSCQGYGDPPKTIAGKHEFRQENQPTRSAFATPTALAQSLALSGNENSHTLMQPMSARMSATQAHPCEGEDHREAALHSIEVEAANFEKYVNMAMYEMLASSESEEFKDLVE
ncbi:hypothetical protein ASPACDRAFT_1851987 [Aspergillus aculeatus ATCC 16872]|uniref:Uncharacterized protein n=1 Tax=Aspergillus aculeatus (strain ATCC 16872 / CBS 172.66 / WB 5094) TaxID=690307 RepID=A0A1L9X9B4_ASPA1|nr:uncharacterized protein ASPACDRAFT_1851987 [Aspergillus aculeatus ATCC 16872]OJK05035.1 hypothetical protein ASPACDRAFT_1851987 [Aspergillus aculeatus ATCC 16872]